SKKIRCRNICPLNGPPHVHSISGFLKKSNQPRRRSPAIRRPIARSDMAYPLPTAGAGWVPLYPHFFGGKRTPRACVVVRARFEEKCESPVAPQNAAGWRGITRVSLTSPRAGSGGSQFHSEFDAVADAALQHCAESIQNPVLGEMVVECFASTASLCGEILLACVRDVAERRDHSWHVTVFDVPADVEASHNCADG